MFKTNFSGHNKIWGATPRGYRTVACWKRMMIFLSVFRWWCPRH